MLKVKNNEVEIYKLEKKIEKLKNKQSSSKRFRAQHSNNIEIEMLEYKLEKLRLFKNYNVIYCKEQSYGEFPFLFNDDKRIVLFLYSNNDSEVVSFDEIEKVEIHPDYINQSYTKTTTRKKGVLGRAVIGGALLGGVGAIVGSATAGSKSKGTTTHYTTFNNYKFLVWFKNGEIYELRSIPSIGVFNKKPPKELLELEFYFNKIINRSEYNRFISENPMSDFDVNSSTNTITDNLKSSTTNSFSNHEIEKKVRKQKVIKVMTNSLLILIVVFSVYIMLLAISPSVQQMTTNTYRHFAGLPKLTERDEDSYVIDSTPVFDFLNFTKSENETVNQLISNNILYSEWEIESGEAMRLVFEQNGFSSDVLEYQEVFKHNNKDLLIWHISDEYGQKEYYFEIDEENSSINLWYHYSDKKDPAQQDPHIIISFIEYFDNTIIFDVKTYWMPTNQIIKDGRYKANRVSTLSHLFN